MCRPSYLLRGDRRGQSHRPRTHVGCDRRNQMRMPDLCQIDRQDVCPEWASPPPRIVHLRHGGHEASSARCLLLVFGWAAVRVVGPDITRDPPCWRPTSAGRHTPGPASRQACPCSGLTTRTHAEGPDHQVGAFRRPSTCRSPGISAPVQNNDDDGSGRLERLARPAAEGFRGDLLVPGLSWDSAIDSCSLPRDALLS